MISAKVVADSKTPNGERLTTLEVVFPRYILAELNTHRVLSKNSASSRAIPFTKMVKEVQENPFIPYAWQKDHKGMQGNEYLSIEESELAKQNWLLARDNTIEEAVRLSSRGVTKQLCNRLLEPFMYHKVLVSATEWENFFKLRCPVYCIEGDNNPNSTTYKSWKDLQKAFPTIITGEESILTRLKYNKGQADIHMMFLAEAIYDARNESTPKELLAEDWHIPYGENFDTEKLKDLLAKTKGRGYDPNNPEPDSNYYDALDDLCCKISIARCARLSYQTLGDNPEINYEKDLELYEVLSKSGHWSPFEHVAKVMTQEEYNLWVKGKLVENFERNDVNYPNDEATGWCRNFRGFIQYRELLDN